MVTTGIFRKEAICGPTHSVAPSLLAIPHRMRSNEPVFSMPFERVNAVANASAPPKARLDKRIPAIGAERHTLLDCTPGRRRPHADYADKRAGSFLDLKGCFQRVPVEGIDYKWYVTPH